MTRNRNFAGLAVPSVRHTTQAACTKPPHASSHEMRGGVTVCSLCKAVSKTAVESPVGILLAASAKAVPARQPKSGVRRGQRAVQSEHDIQKTIIDWLELQSDIECERMNNGAFVGEHKGKRRFVEFGTVGGPDLRVTLHVPPWGVRIDLECKRAGGEQSDNQRIYESRFKRVGVRYHVVDSLEQAVGAIESARALAREWSRR